LISINMRDPRPIYLQIKEGLCRLILTGVLAEDEKLPSVRELAGQLAINPNTIQRAYRELEAAGYVYSSAGKGSFVAPSDETSRLHQKELLGRLDSLVAELEAAGIGRERIVDHLTRGDEQ